MFFAFITNKLLSYRIFIRLAVVAFQICEITQNSKKIPSCSRSSTSEVIDHGANRKRTCTLLLVIKDRVERIFSFWHCETNYKTATNT